MAAGIASFTPAPRQSINQNEARIAMRSQLNVYDSDTHLAASAETLAPFLTTRIRTYLPELDTYLRPKQFFGYPGPHQPRSVYFFGKQKPSGWWHDALRYLGEAEPRYQETRRNSRFQGSQYPADGGDDWSAQARIHDMDREGVEVHLMVPQVFGQTGIPEADIEFLRAHHRHLDAFCGEFPKRLKSLLVASPLYLEASLDEIRRWASHPWGAMRVLAAFWGAGLADRYPHLKLAILESGFGWLPFWSRRMDAQRDYMGYVSANLKMSAHEWMQSGRFFASLVLHEGGEMAKMVSELLGEHILMFSSDYPHPESRFPDSVKQFEAWEFPESLKRKIIWNNAIQCFGEP